MILMHKLISTFFFVGKLPKAPGTWGSLFAALIWWYIPLGNYAQITIIIFVTILGTYSAESYSRRISKKDPSEVVIDEVAGMWIALMFVPKNLILFIFGFVLFRFLDIKKPLIINSVQYLPGGYGIMADDVIAGLITCLFIHIGVNIL